MRTADCHRLKTGAAAVGVLLMATACLPIAHSYLLSPMIVGSYRGSDGRPMAGSFELGTGPLGDSTCTATTLHAKTDSAGAFSFAPQEIRSKWTPLIPFDAVASGYSLCYRVGGHAREVYRGIVLRETVRDSITCLAVSQADALALRCLGQSPMPRLR